jgi:isopenicillin-N N-acyltransferase-like protein
VATSAAHTLPLLRVEGSHYEVGLQIGAATAAAVASRAEAVPEGVLAAAQPYLAVTRRELPWLWEELCGVAEGAGVDPERVFAASVEELDEDIYDRDGRCSDLAAGPPATADGHVWIAHNNDLPAATEDDVVAIEWRVPGDPTVFTIGIGPWISVGFNSAGLALTGNELAPNDNRVGIPRLLGVRDQVRRPTVEAAVEAALHPHRASSYNTVFCHRDGEIVSVEGSATDCELLRPDKRGTLAHTNHYVGSRMRRYEADVPGARRSAVRYRRALRWLAEGEITRTTLRAALSDHSDAPESICRHSQHGSNSKTVFWCVADVTVGEITFGRGNPCDSEEQLYVFA